jgi:hypothetical protein
MFHKDIWVYSSESIDRWNGDANCAANIETTDCQTHSDTYHATHRISVGKAHCYTHRNQFTHGGPDGGAYAAAIQDTDDATNAATALEKTNASANPGAYHRHSDWVSNIYAHRWAHRYCFPNGAAHRETH